MIASPAPHRPSTTSAGLAQCGSMNQSGAEIPGMLSRNVLIGPVVGLNR